MSAAADVIPSPCCGRAIEADPDEPTEAVCPACQATLRHLQAATFHERINRARRASAGAPASMRAPVRDDLDALPLFGVIPA